jgi:hypothetical protein
VKLNEKALPELKISVPQYDRSQVNVGIAHFGVGGFHRAHQAMYVDRLLNEGLANDWGICGVGVLPGDKRMRDALMGQDGLYTLIIEHPDGTREPHVIGSIVDFRYAPDDPEAVIKLLADPNIRIISLTVTEGGYNIRDDDGEFDTENPGVRHDLEAREAPVTVFGLVTAAMARRRDRDVPAPTIVSCDNIVENGNVARRAFISYAELSDPLLAQWMRDHIRFPNSMVDRITPVTTPDIPEQLEKDFGVTDAWPVATEPFTSWVLEDDFADARPPFEKAGVQLVDDVAPYEMMKLRLLNASHQSLCYFAYLAGYRLVHDAAQDPVIAEFLRLSPCQASTSSNTSTHCWSGSPTPTSVTPSPGCAPSRPTGSRSGSCRWCVTTSAPGARCGWPRRPSRAGRATPRASTRTASRSRWSTGSPSHWYRWPARSATTRRRSSPTARCSAISSTSRASSNHTCGHSILCTATVLGQRWRPC